MCKRFTEKNGHLVFSNDDSMSVDAVYSFDVHRYFSNPNCSIKRKELSDEIEACIDAVDALYQQATDKDLWRSRFLRRAEVVCVSYHAEKLCSYLRCSTRGPVEAKTGENGITSWVCRSCNTVQADDVFSDLGKTT